MRTTESPQHNDRGTRENRLAERPQATLEALQQREEHWVIADLAVKGGHVRTVPVPTWVKATIDAWTTAAPITHGTVFRAINKAAEFGATA